MKKIFSLWLAVFLVAIMAAPVAAIQCEGDLPTDKNDLQLFVDACQAKISTLQAEQKSLRSAISLLSSKINLTTAKIKSTAVQIEQLEKDIQTLGGVITDLNFTLDDLTQIYISRLRQAYKNRTTNPLVLLFASDSFKTFQNKLKYLTLASKRDQIILHELETTRVDLDDQKTSKEEKQTEVEKLRASLESQKRVLGEQTTQKNQLLAETQNSEKKYQQLKADAEAQLAAFASYVSSQGGASILSGQTNCTDWGCYYNQRDSLWGNHAIGASSISMADAGCLVTSIAMVASHYGKSLTPGQIASSTQPFSSYSPAYMIWDPWTVNGITVDREILGSSSNLSNARSLIDNELNNNRPAVIGVYWLSGTPKHFLVVVKKQGDDYLVHDPFEPSGHDRTFSSLHGSTSNITRVERININ